MDRKCSFRYLFVNPETKERRVVTQDVRRSQRVVTGNVRVFDDDRLTDQHVARQYDCQAIFRVKTSGT